MKAVSPGTAPTKHSQRDGGFNAIDVRGARRQARRKYTFTGQIDQLIREVYRSRRDSKTRGSEGWHSALAAEEARP